MIVAPDHWTTTACEEVPGRLVWGVGYRGDDAKIIAGLDTTMLVAARQFHGMCDIAHDACETALSIGTLNAPVYVRIAQSSTGRHEKPRRSSMSIRWHLSCTSDDSTDQAFPIAR